MHRPTEASTAQRAVPSEHRGFSLDREGATIRARPDARSGLRVVHSGGRSEGRNAGNTDTPEVPPGRGRRGFGRSGGQPEQLNAFARAVERASGGTLRIQFAPNWRGGDFTQERDTIADVRAGRVDLAWVGARAWDWEGVRGFDALLAPFLVDSHALEQRVFERGIPQRMLPAVRKAAVVPIAVLPVPLRSALGVGHALLAPADFRGKTIGVQGVVAAETLRALGARPRQYSAQPTLNGLDG